MVLILYRNVKSNLHNAPKCLQVSQIQNVNKSLPGNRVYTKDFYTKMSSFIKEFECTQFHTREVFVSSVSPVYNLSMVPSYDFKASIQHIITGYLVLHGRKGSKQRTVNLSLYQSNRMSVSLFVCSLTPTKRRILMS